MHWTRNKKISLLSRAQPKYVSHISSHLSIYSIYYQSKTDATEATPPIENDSTVDSIAPETSYEFQDEPEASETEEPPASDTPSESGDTEDTSIHEDDEKERERLDVEPHPAPDGTQIETRDETDSQSDPSSSKSEEPIYDDPSDEDDGEGEWITPSNVAVHKSKALQLLPEDAASKKGKNREQIGVGCMTADFAMQNVLLQMNLGLIGVEGKKIDRVKTWGLRCHACFK